MGTQLYDLNHKEIFPISEATAINTSGNASVNNIGNVEGCLSDIYSKIADLSGEKDLVNSIKFIPQYIGLKSKELADALNVEPSEWSSAFTLPDTNNPYIWKKTTILFAGADENNKLIFYEIVATDAAEKTLSIYIATASEDTSEIAIEYDPKRDPMTGDILKDEQGNELLDLTKYDNSLPNNWSDSPQPISPSRPYAFMSTRKWKDGAWEKYSDPALYGRWAFDSLLELRYRVTTDGSIPDVIKTEDNPGNEWLKEAPTEFTGKLWMVTATSVNGKINLDGDGIKWKGPNLMAII